VLYRAGQANDRITGFIGLAAEAHGAHCGDGDRSPSNSSEDLDHAIILATLTDSELARTTWFAVLTVALARFLALWCDLNLAGAGFSFYSH
jgi:hypothetical protein